MVHDYPPLSGGGLAISVLDLCRSLGNRFECRVVTSRLVDHFGDDRSAASGGEPEWTLAPSRRAVRWLRDADILLVHWTFSFRWLSTLATVIGPLTGVPTICVVHTEPEHCSYNRLRGFPPALRDLLTRLLAVTLRRCIVVALSHSHAAALRRAGLDPDRVAPLPVGGGRAAPRGAHPREATVGFAGELSELKGADALPTLIAALSRRHRFVIAGDGPLMPRLCAAITHLPRENRERVAVLGLVRPQKMDRLYDAIDVVVIPSRTESQCRVALEAMLAGVLVLARPCDGLADLVENEVTGLLFDVADPAAVEAALARLADDPASTVRLREAARAHAQRLVETSTRDWRRLVGEAAALRRGTVCLAGGGRSGGLHVSRPVSTAAASRPARGRRPGGAHDHERHTGIEMVGDARVWAENAGFENVSELADQDQLRQATIYRDVKRRIERQWS